MESLPNKNARKKLSEVLVEEGILTADEMPKGLEYAQKVTDADVVTVQQAKQLIAEKGLDVPTALKGINYAKQKRCALEQALTELGWRPRQAVPVEEAPRKSHSVTTSFDRSELDQIGRRNVGGGPPPLPPAAPAPANGGASPEGAAAFDPSELDAIKPSESLARKSMYGLKAMSAVQTAHGNPIATLGSRNTTGKTPKPGGKKDHLELITEADHAYGRRNYELAEQLYVQALEALETKPDSTLREVSDLLVKTGSACIQVKQFVRAEQYFCRAMKIRELQGGPEDMGVAECLDLLAELFCAQSQMQQAEQYYLSALGIKERVLPSGSSEVADTLKKLVAVTKHKGLQPEEKKSGELLTEAGVIDAMKLEEGLTFATKNNLPVGRALISLSYVNENDLEAVLQAQFLMREGVVPSFVALRALKLAISKPMKFREALAEIGVDLGESCTPEVLQLLHAAQQLVDAERDLPADDPGLAVLCTKLGDLYMEHHRLQQAELLYVRATEIIRKTDGKNRDQVVMALTKLGTLHYTKGDYPRAKNMLTKVLSLFEPEKDAHDASFIVVAESLAAVRYVTHEFEEAAGLYQSAIAGKEQTLGADHARLIAPLQGKANCLFALKRYEEAEPLYLRACELTSKAYGENSEHVAGIASVLGDLRFAKRDFAAAQADYMRCLDAIGNATTPDLHLFCSTLEKIARCCSEQNDYQKADAYYRHYLKSAQACGIGNTPVAADALDRHAVVLEKLNRNDEAAVCRQKAESLRKA